MDPESVTPAMARFDQLPAEVLLHITSLIIPHRDLVSFARANRTTYSLSKDKLRLRRKYRRIRFRPRTDTDLDNAFSILMAILRRPQIGEYVRHIEVDRPPTTMLDYEIRNVDLKKLDDDDFKRLREAVQDAGFTGQYGEKVINMILQPYEFRSAWSGLVLTAFQSTNNGILRIDQSIVSLNNV